MGTGGIFLRKVRARFEDEPTGFVWVEPAKLAGSGYPASKSQVEWLVGAGVDSILTLTEKPLPPDSYRGLKVNVSHISMRDHQPPGIGSMSRGVDFILQKMGEGRTVLVHCLAGEGRTGCVLAAYLVRSRGIGAEEAIATLRKIKPLFVEPQQEQAVRDFAAVEPRSR